ncbi:MAG TPA: type II secretion system protein GspM [Polaromonas sp.]|uniref:type II secretion system protein GspM n=1 Tax=Polaromonas sp. TaxID=1869339 RepID=UPI002D347AD7|nr:type II secretion system protein GspM [Polaromonas sp.]HYW58394.1 type II secretion system protein GspM [Polaromonas sp.]
MNASSARVRGVWRGLAKRDQTILGLGLASAIAMIVILLGIIPAARTLHSASTRQAQVDKVLLHMQVLQARAQALQTQPRLNRDEALQALQASLPLLGDNVQMAVNDQRATVTVLAARPDALAQWLVHARVNARAIPLEARLIRSRTGIEATWDGTLVLTLPTR